MKATLIQWAKNKFVITGLVFVVWITFFRDIDLLYVMQSSRELNETKEQVDELENKNLHTKELLNEYKTNPKVSEQFAREEYYMRKADEEIFLVKEAK